MLFLIGYYNTKVGRNGPVDNFVNYAKWALSKIGVDNKQVCVIQKSFYTIYSFSDRNFTKHLFLDTIYRCSTRNISKSCTF